MGAHSESRPLGKADTICHEAPKELESERCDGSAVSFGQCGFGGGLPGILPGGFGCGQTKTFGRPKSSPALGDGLEW